LGSENLLAKYFGLTCDVEATALAIEAMRTIALDVYDANGKICLLMASVGFDADVVHHVHRNRESHVTRWKYWKSIMWSLSSYRWPSLHIELLDAEGRTIESFDGDWLFAFNVPRYAANLQILECAQIDDGLLEVCGFRGSGLWTGLQHYWSVRSGGHEQLSTWFRKRASGARISEANSDRSINHAGGASFQLDGDWGGELPLEIRFTGERATLVVPPKSDD
jgi:diacylglycerol kinase family enzyme